MYLEDILTSTEYKSGIVKFTLPDAKGTGDFHEVKGLVEQDIAFKMGVSWGSVLPDMTTFSEMSQIINSSNIVSWVSSSTGAWKGTDPFTFDLTFYLVTYKYNQSPSIKQQARWFADLCALYVDGDNFATVQVHGGYKLDLADSNNSPRDTFFDSNLNPNSDNIRKLLSSNKGLIAMELGDSIKVDKLLINNVTITPSSVQVQKGVPLYIKVDASFRTHRSLKVDDVSVILGD